MPDFFQGTEFWDFSLVDPDNRRPVDYAARRQVKTTTVQSWRDGRIKQAVILQVLALRRRTPDLFAHGDYSPLPVKGPLEDHIVAFTRTHGRSAVVVVVPRLVHGLLQDDSRITLNPSHLRDNTLLLPEQLHGRSIKSLLSDAKVATVGPDLPLLPLLADFPSAVLDLG
jgi:(1->4)-alpha-D-glucan 1-alpha-D-glucosylmutase